MSVLINTMGAPWNPMKEVDSAAENKRMSPWRGENGLSVMVSVFNFLSFEKRRSLALITVDYSLKTADIKKLPKPILPLILRLEFLA